MNLVKLKYCLMKSIIRLYFPFLVLLIWGCESDPGPGVPLNRSGDTDQYATSGTAPFVAEIGSILSGIDTIPRCKRILIDATHDGGAWWCCQAGVFNATADHQGLALANFLKLAGYKVFELPRGATVTDRKSVV